MEPENSEIWILSTLEVQLCLEILGCEEPEIFPVFPNARPLEERIVGAYHHLIEMGFLRQSADGCRGTEQLDSCFALIAQPGYTLQVLENGKLPVFYAGGGAADIHQGKVSVLEQISTQDQMLRLYEIDKEELIARLAGIAEEAEPIPDFEHLPLYDQIRRAEARIRGVRGSREEVSLLWMSETGRKIRRKIRQKDRANDEAKDQTKNKTNDKIKDQTKEKVKENDWINESESKTFEAGMLDWLWKEVAQ